MTDERKLPEPPPGYRFNPFADAMMGRSLFDLVPSDWLEPVEPSKGTDNGR